MEKRCTSYLPIIFDAATAYEKYLLGKCFLFICRGTKTGDISFYEVEFTDRHFQHLTGIKPKPGINSTRFLELCLERRLSAKDISVLPTGQSALKVEVIGPLMRLPYTARMMGDHNGSGDFLYTEKLAGSTVGCMGFVFDTESGIYVPNTILKVDIRDHISEVKQIVAVYQKDAKKEYYSTNPITCSKNLRGKNLVWPSEIMEKFDLG